jgi:hypothetical protein
MNFEFGAIKRLNPKSVWPDEARYFTPWLAENLDELGSVLGMDLELLEVEASVGDFNVDILARNLGTGDEIVIENQFGATDHDHLGKLITYGSGFDAGAVVWIAESIREEHRQALEWLNQRTDSETQFFAIIMELIQVDESNPAFNFRPVVFPNEWKKSRRSRVEKSVSPRAERYRVFFQGLIDRLREEHRFTSAKAGQPQNWYSFTSGISGISYGASFAQGDRIRAEIYIDPGDQDVNKALFDKLHKEKQQIENEFGQELEWERLDEKRASRIAIYRPGNIEDTDDDLREYETWLIANLLNFKSVFHSRISSSANH